MPSPGSDIDGGVSAEGTPNESCLLLSFPWRTLAIDTLTYSESLWYQPHKHELLPQIGLATIEKGSFSQLSSFVDVILSSSISKEANHGRGR